MLKKIMSAVAAIAVLASVWALSLTTAFAQETDGSGDTSTDTTVDVSGDTGEAGFPEEYEDVYDAEGDLPDGYTLAEPPEDEQGDYYYDDDYYYDWYDDGSYDYDWQDYEWNDWEDIETDDWTDEDYDAYWDEYEWEDAEWEDMAYGYYSIYDEVDFLVALLDEIDMIYQEYTLAELEMPADIADGLVKISEETYKILENEKLAPLYDLARDTIESSAEYSYEEQQAYYEDAWAVDYSADVDYLLQAIYDFWDQDPYAMLDYAWDYLDSYYYSWDVRTEIEWMLEDVVFVESFVDTLASLEVDDFQVSWAIDNLVALMPEARLTLEEMLAVADQSETDEYYYEMLDLYWDILDGIEMVFYDNMQVIAEYLNENPDKLDELYNLTPEGADMILAWLEEPIEPEYNYEEDFEKYYGDIEYEYDDGEDFEAVFSDTFKEEDLYDEIISKVSGRIMEKLAPYFEDIIAKAIFTNIMTYMDVLGEDIANAFLENQTVILETLDFDIENTGDLKDDLKALHERVKSTVVPDSFKDELEKAIEDLRSRVALGANDEEVSTAIEAVRVVLDKIDYENVFGENPIEFKDVPFEEELVWYWEHVMNARNEGIVNGFKDASGNLTGEFKPANNVTYAEALKMLMEAGGYGSMPIEEGMAWYQGYLNSFHQLGFEAGFERVGKSEPADWNAPAPRGDILVMANAIFDIRPVDYVAGTFPDVSADDELADDAMASYLAGIFTGHSESGKLDPNGYIDRASLAKVISIALEYLAEINFAGELGEFRDMLEKEGVGNPDGD